MIPSFSISKRLDDRIRYLSRYTMAVRSKQPTMLVGEIFCLAVAEEVWQSSAEIAAEIGVPESTVRHAIDAYR